MKATMWICVSAVVLSTLMAGIQIAYGSSWHRKTDDSAEVPQRFNVPPPTHSHEEVLGHPNDFFRPSPSMLEGLPLPAAGGHDLAPIDTSSPTTIPLGEVAPQAHTPALFLPMQGLDRTHPIEVQHPLLPVEVEVPRHDLRKRK